MNILCLDDETLALERLVDKVLAVEPSAAIRSFHYPEEALENLKSDRFLPDAAFLDIEMVGMSGIEFAKKLKDICPRVKVVFVTGFSEYAIEAYRIHAGGYLMKPVTENAIRKELDYMKQQDALLFSTDKKIQVQCFGNFEVYYKNNIVRFARNKTKELFAYLIDKKGSSATTAEIISVLWEDKDRYSSTELKMFTTLVSDIRGALAAIGAESVLMHRRNAYSVNTCEIDCDYYRFLAGDVTAINSFTGEYMAQYSWAEFTCGYLICKDMKD